jgi:hypothetical protein
VIRESSRESEFQRFGISPGVTKDRHPAISMTRTISPLAVRWVASSLPIASTAVSRFSTRTAISSPPGINLASQARFSSDRMTRFMSASRSAPGSAPDNEHRRLLGVELTVKPIGRPSASKDFPPSTANRFQQSKSLIECIGDLAPRLVRRSAFRRARVRTTSAKHSVDAVFAGEILAGEEKLEVQPSAEADGHRGRDIAGNGVVHIGQ